MQPFLFYIFFTKYNLRNSYLKVVFWLNLDYAIIIFFTYIKTSKQILPFIKH